MGTTSPAPSDETITDSLAIPALRPIAKIAKPTIEISDKVRLNLEKFV